MRKRILERKSDYLSITPAFKNKIKIDIKWIYLSR